MASATLTLTTADTSYYAVSHANAPTPSTAFPVSVFEAAGSWGTSTTWNSSPGATAATPGLISLTDTSNFATNPAHVVTYSVDVTSIVQDWISGTVPNNGFILVGQTVVGDGTTAARSCREATWMDRSCFTRNRTGRRGGANRARARIGGAGHAGSGGLVWLRWKRRRGAG